MYVCMYVNKDSLWKSSINCNFIFSKVITFWFLTHTWYMPRSSTQLWSTWYETMNDCSCMREKVGCGQNFTYIFRSNVENRAIFCKDLTNIVSCVLWNNEHLVIFHFQINPNFSSFSDFGFLTGVNSDSAPGHAKPIAWVRFSSLYFFEVSYE